MYLHTHHSMLQTTSMHSMQSHPSQQLSPQRFQPLAAAAAAAAAPPCGSSAMLDIVPSTTGHRPVSPGVFDPSLQLLNGPVRRAHGGSVAPLRDDREAYITRVWDIAQQAQKAINDDVSKERNTEEEKKREEWRAALTLLVRSLLFPPCCSALLFARLSPSRKCSSI